MLGQIHVLVSILRRTTSYSILGYPSNAQTSHWSATYGATGLTHALLQDLLLAGLNASGFSESQRWDLVQAAEWAGEKIRISPLARWWPFEVLGRKMGVEEDVVEVSLALFLCYSWGFGSSPLCMIPACIPDPGTLTTPALVGGWHYRFGVCLFASRFGTLCSPPSHHSIRLHPHHPPPYTFPQSPSKTENPLTYFKYYIHHLTAHLASNHPMATQTHNPFRTFSVPLNPNHNAATLAEQGAHELGYVLQLYGYVLPAQ